MLPVLPGNKNVIATKTRILPPYKTEFTALIFLVVVNIAYSIFMSDFAELRIEPFFLNFPIFIGEVVLGFLLLLAADKSYFEGYRITTNHYWLISLLGFILIKAFLGYIFYSPLALRNAALYYYFLFAVLVYYFYQPFLFTYLFKSEKDKALTLALVLFLILSRFVCEYYLYSYLVVIVILLLEIKPLLARFLIAISLIWIFPFTPFLSTSRGSLLANGAALSYVIFLLLCFIIRKGWMKFVCFAFIIPSIVLGSYSAMSDGTRERVNDFIFVRQWQTLYKDAREIANQRIRVGRRNFEFGVLLFEDNQKNQVKPSKQRRFSAKEGWSTAPVNTDAASETVVSIDKPAAEEESLLNYRHRIASAGNVVWRLLLWEDMMDEMGAGIKKSPTILVWGFPFGKPIRSKRQEAISLAFPIQTGWLEPHNAFFHIIYRTGLIGLAFVVAAVWKFIQLSRKVIQLKSVSGALLLSSLVYWIVFSMTTVALELPHYAIFFWTLVGFSAAYIDAKSKQQALNVEC